MKNLALLLLLLTFFGCSHKNVQQEPYSFVEQMPSFPGGEAEMQRFIREHYKYPPTSYEQEEQGKIIVKFVISKTGEIKDIQAVEGGVRCDSLISVIKRMPRWNPGNTTDRLSMYIILYRCRSVQCGDKTFSLLQYTYNFLPTRNSTIIGVVNINIMRLGKQNLIAFKF